MLCTSDTLLAGQGTCTAVAGAQAALLSFNHICFTVSNPHCPVVADAVSVSAACIDQSRPQVLAAPAGSSTAAAVTTAQQQRAAPSTAAADAGCLWSPDWQLTDRGSCGGASSV